MKTKTIKKAIMLVSVISIIGFTGYAFANMGFGSHMGGYGGGNHMMNGYGDGYQGHMGGYGQYTRHMDNGGHMVDSGQRGTGMYNRGHMYDNGYDHNRMIEDMDRFHNGYGRDQDDFTGNKTR